MNVVITVNVSREGTATGDQNHEIGEGECLRARWHANGMAVTGTRESLQDERGLRAYNARPRRAGAVSRRMSLEVGGCPATVASFRRLLRYAPAAFVHVMGPWYGARWRTHVRCRTGTNEPSRQNAAWAPLRGNPRRLTGQSGSNSRSARWCGENAVC